MNPNPKSVSKYPKKEWLVKFNHQGKYLQATVKASNRIMATKTVCNKFPEAIVQSAKALTETPGFTGLFVPNIPKDLKEAFVEYHRKRGILFKDALTKLMADFLTRHGVDVPKEMLNPLKNKRYYPDETETEK